MQGNLSQDAGVTMRLWETYTDDELADFLSDYHKDVFGYRPAHYLFATRERMISEIQQIESFMATAKTSVESRRRLEEDGWAF